MIITGNVGPQIAADGAQNIPARMDRLGGLTVTELRARYAENTRRGLRMWGANQAGVTTSIGLALACTGLILANPPGSPVNLELDKAGFSVLVAFAAAASIGIMVGYNSSTALTGTTIDGQGNEYAGGAIGYGQIFKAATLPTAPTLRRLLASGLTGAITTAVETPGDIVDLEGSIILPPGGYAAFFTSSASGASGFQGSLSWTEVAP